MADFLLVHGGSHGAWCWRRLIAALEELGHRGHALDLPGAGDDPTPRGEVTVAGCLDAVDRFVAERGRESFHLVGHSIAGLLLPGDARACFARLTPQPLSVSLEPATVGAREIEAPTRYVVCTRDRTFPPEQCRALAAKLGGATVELDAGHDAMLSRPAELARLLARPLGLS